MKPIKNSSAIITALLLSIVVIVSSKTTHAQNDKNRSVKREENVDIRINNNDTLINGVEFRNLTSEERERFRKEMQGHAKEIKRHREEMKKIHDEMKTHDIRIERIEADKKGMKGFSKSIVIIGDSVIYGDSSGMNWNWKMEEDTDGKHVIIIDGKGLRTPSSPHRPFDSDFHFFNFNDKSNDVNEEAYVFMYKNGAENTVIRMVKPTKDELDKLYKKKSNDKEFTQLRIYPNPSGGEFNLSFDLKGKGSANIQILNESGKEVYNEKVDSRSGNSYEKTFNLKDYPAGVYFVTVTQNGEQVTRKIILGNE